MSREEADRVFEETFPDWSRAEALRARHEPATGIVLEALRAAAEAYAEDEEAPDGGFIDPGVEGAP